MKRLFGLKVAVFVAVFPLPALPAPSPDGSCANEECFQNVGVWGYIGAGLGSQLLLAAIQPKSAWNYFNRQTGAWFGVSTRSGFQFTMFNDFLWSKEVPWGIAYDLSLFSLDGFDETALQGKLMGQYEIWRSYRAQILAGAGVGYLNRFAKKEAEPNLPLRLAVNSTLTSKLKWKNTFDQAITGRDRIFQYNTFFFYSLKPGAGSVASVVGVGYMLLTGVSGRGTEHYILLTF